MIPTKIRIVLDDDRGATMVEAGVVLPVFLLIVLGAMYWSLILWQQISLQHAVEMGARCASLSGGSSSVSNPYCGYIQCSPGGGCVTKHAILGGTNLSTMAATSGSAVCAYSVSHTNKFVIPFLAMLPTQLKASFCLTQQAP